MSKLGKVKKLIRTPKKFFLDSWLFKTENFPTMGNYKNLFIISHLGQLHQVESLIESEQLEECFLVILWTKKNVKMPKLVQKSINKNLISSSMLLLLPNSPNNYKVKSLKIMQNNYHKLIDIINPQNLYMLSFENHYVLLSDYAKKKHISIHLIDEGTGSYKSREQSEYAIKTSFLKKLLTNLLGLSVVESWYTDYETIYASFPELLKNTFKANEYIKFSAHSGQFNLDAKTKELIDCYGITDEDFIYVNQRYAIKDKDFVNAIVKILNKISIYKNAKVFIKMHPKDTGSIKNTFIQIIKNYENIIFIKENEFLIEPTIQAVNPKGVIGLTSTSLVYAPLISPNTKVYSIKPWFVNLVASKDNEKGIEIINDHFDILKQFKHVVYIESENDLESINDDILVVEKNNDTDIYKKIARKSYEEGKCQKTIVNYGWGYPEGITTMLIDDFVKYLECFYNKVGIKQTLEIVREWIDTEVIRDTNNELNYYSGFIKELVNLIDKNQEYGYQLEIENIYHNLLALITSTLNKSEYSIDSLMEEIFLLETYEENLLPLLVLKAKKYMLDNKYTEANKILTNVLNYEDYISDNEDVNIYLLETLIRLDKKEEMHFLNNAIQEKAIIDEIKIIADSMILNYEKKYSLSVDLLVSEIDNFTHKTKETLKPELILAKAYRYLENYQEAKSCLIKFEKHSKGNLSCNREIAYLEYSNKNYTKAITQFNRGYPQGITTIPIDDFVKYLECFYNSKQYLDIIYSSRGNVFKNSTLDYYYLASLNKLSLFTKFVEEYKRINNFNPLIVQNQLLTTMLIQALREVGKIEDALLLIDTSLTESEIENLDEIDYLISIVEIYELSKKFKKANYIWNIIIKKFKNKLPSDAWLRYYASSSL